MKERVTSGIVKVLAPQLRNWDDGVPPGVDLAIPNLLERAGGIGRVSRFWVSLLRGLEGATVTNTPTSRFSKDTDPACVDRSRSTGPFLTVHGRVLVERLLHLACPGS